MPRLVLALTLLATLAACDSAEGDRSGREQLDPAALLGTWTWERTVACGDGSTGCTETTPASTGRSETLTFLSPDPAGVSGVVLGYFNGTTLELTDYTVTTMHVDTDTRPIWSARIDLSENGSYNEVFLSGDRLVISSAAVDGPETTYRRPR